MLRFWCVSWRRQYPRPRSRKLHPLNRQLCTAQYRVTLIRLQCNAAHRNTCPSPDSPSDSMQSGQYHEPSSGGPVRSRHAAWYSLPQLLSQAINTSVDDASSPHTLHPEARALGTRFTGRSSTGRGDDGGDGPSWQI
ncbi:hypothetical protein H257_06175 [Aphanomyces astaci]|uniref:Uncharacterized protein n=1 Tax=Aphanomyces astaci TaxID=112090 RepID=W4GNT8_APHAT|nr:hypothetical protein H257_06175 [Aphanomyces astaci]ETV80659.1 hypothetical protein H257_06175 [Aphanomyces astaci]|eukprot:XP_009829606.1 hypothetical protein H257_06175 [Aphanomyces astaci]